MSKTNLEGDFRIDAQPQQRRGWFFRWHLWLPGPLAKLDVFGPHLGSVEEVSFRVMGFMGPRKGEDQS